MENTTKYYDSIDRFIILFFLAANVVMIIANILLIKTIYNFFKNYQELQTGAWY